MAPMIAREAFKLKRLTSLPLWRGQLVHYVASKVLQSMKKKGRIPPREDVISYTIERFDRQLAFSRDKRYLSEPKKRGKRINLDWLALVDHEYGRELSRDRIEQTKRECVQAVGALLENPILRTAEGADQRQWEIEDLDHAEFSQNFPFDNVTVYAKTDFIFRGDDGTFNIIDWKTGGGNSAAGAEDSDPANAGIQLGVYGYYASEVRGEPLHMIRLYEVGLLRGGEVIEYRVDGENLEKFRSHIRNGIKRLASHLVNEDPERNEPLAPARFEEIDNGRCRFCNFYRICKDEDRPRGLLW